MNEKDLGSAVAKEIMTPFVISLNSDATFENVINTLVENRITAVFIHDPKTNDYYIISQRYIVKFLKRDGLKSINLAQTSVKEIMKGPIETVDVQTPVETVIRFMTEHDYKRVLISENGKATGVISTKDIMKWNDTYFFKPAVPQILFFVDNLTSNLIGRHIFKKNIQDEVQDDLIDIYGGALNSISIITNQLIKESGKMTHLMKDKRAVLFEPRDQVTGILICDFNSVDLRRKLIAATDLFCK
ncbi:MAG: CBS domain-containing protein, partial [Promethearchaeota archaeon]